MMRIRPFASLAMVCSLLLLSSCGGAAPSAGFSELDFALADPGSGEKLFNQSNNEAPACAACHSTSGGIGNSLAGIAAIAAQRVSGQSAEEYLYWSIIRPARYLVPGYANLMYAEYETRLEAADIADLIAYMLTLE